VRLRVVTISLRNGYCQMYPVMFMISVYIVYMLDNKSYKQQRFG